MMQLYIEKYINMFLFFLFLRFFFAFQILQYFIFPTNFIKMSFKSNNLLITFSPRKLHPNPRKVRIYFLVYFILSIIIIIMFFNDLFIIFIIISENITRCFNRCP